MVATLQIIPNDFIGEEAFIVGMKAEDTEDCVFGTVDFFNSHVELQEELNNTPVDSSDDMAVLHGIVTRATSLPEEIPSGIAAYVVAIQGSGGAIFEITSYDPNDISDLIMDLVNGIGSEGEGTEYEPIDIDDIYVVYGYEIAIAMTINDDDIDEERLSKASQVNDSISVEEEQEEAGVS